MQQTTQPEMMIKSRSSDTKQTLIANADVCVRNIGAQILLRPLDGAEYESRPIAGYCVASSGLVTTNHEDHDETSSGSDNTVKNPLQHNHQNLDGSRRAPSADDDTDHRQEPDPAGPGTVSPSSVDLQIKRGNQTANVSEGAAFITDSSGTRDASKLLCMKTPSGCMNKASNKEVDRKIFNSKPIDLQSASLGSEPGRPSSSSPPVNIASSNVRMGGESVDPLTSGDESETMTTSEEASSSGGCTKSEECPFKAGPEVGFNYKSSYEADTLRIIKSLNDQRRELQQLDRQLSGLIESHLRSIGRSCQAETVDWCESPTVVYQQPEATPTGRRSPDDSANYYGSNQVIDLTMSGGKLGTKRKDESGQQVAESVAELQVQALAREYHDATTHKSATSPNLGQFSSVNLRKSRLLGATIGIQQATRIAGHCSDGSVAQNPHLMERAGAGYTCSGGRDGAIAAEGGSAAPEMSPAAVMSHDIQQLKRLRLSGQSMSSSGTGDESPSMRRKKASTSDSSGTSQSSSSIETRASAENNLDLLRDFMLHNQYLPSHLVLECLSQCQKQTSTSSTLLPSAIPLVDASSSPSSSTARNQTANNDQAAILRLADHAAADRQRINHPHHHHHHHHYPDHHRHQRGSFVEFNNPSSHYYQQNVSSAVLDGSADLRQQKNQQQLARSRAFQLATSRLLDHQLPSFASHHQLDCSDIVANADSNQIIRPLASIGADHYLSALPMTRDIDNNSTSFEQQQQQQQQQQLHTSQETLELMRSTMGKSNHQHLISMADIQRVAFKCHVCGSGFEDRHRLQQHLSIHLNLQPHWFEEKTIAETMAQYESKRGDYLCNICDIRFETTAEFDKHMQAHGDKPHRCDLCSQDNKLVSFRYYRQLLTHLRSHCFLYSCRFAPDCKQTSNRKDYLKLHILKHHLNNQLPEQYTICCH